MIKIYTQISGEWENPYLEEEYVDYLKNTIKKIETYSYNGALIYYNHNVMDPWILVSKVLELSKKIVPVVAVQPYAIPPYSLAKIIKSLTVLYNRKININLIAGASKSELEQTNELMIHDERYKRLKEYKEVLEYCLTQNTPLSYNGQYYNYKDLYVNSKISFDLMPEFFVSGSSESGVEVGIEIGDVIITHPEPISLFLENNKKSLSSLKSNGIRIGIIARDTAQKAWDIAVSRYPQTREGKIKTIMRAKSENTWSRKIAKLALNGDIYDKVYWTGAFKTGGSSYPLLVGDYDEVANYLQSYVDAGVETFILGGIDTKEDYFHSSVVFKKLLQR
ncbi:MULTISPECIES: LLM class flavin-dependent oxidoreductase [Bacillus]|uniref:LLM class flavin-dependent oxidoreductase n=1 Tax=Bacillus TaxID=1386 RepID=UPI001F5690B0|nr:MULTISPECIES: LLM class flavin-dependent oxidoreductase [Bacillus cereus group]USL15360.1 LLM class flavin-dependent oxidoreductase [Bacillus thuringiensis]